MKMEMLPEKGDWVRGLNANGNLVFVLTHIEHFSGKRITLGVRGIKSGKYSSLQERGQTTDKNRSLHSERSIASAPLLILNKGPSSTTIIYCFAGLLDDLHGRGATSVLVMHTLTEPTPPADAEEAAQSVEHKREEGAEAVIPKPGLKQEALLEVRRHESRADAEDAVVGLDYLRGLIHNDTAGAIASNAKAGRGTGRPREAGTTIKALRVRQRRRDANIRRENLLQFNIGQVLETLCAQQSTATQLTLTSAEAERPSRADCESPSRTSSSPTEHPQSLCSPRSTQPCIQSMEASMVSITSLFVAPAQWAPSELQTRNFKIQLMSRNLSPSRHQSPVALISNSGPHETSRRHQCNMGGRKHGAITRFMMDQPPLLGWWCPYSVIITTSVVLNYNPCLNQENNRMSSSQKDFIVI